MFLISHYLLVGLGGAFGSMARYGARHLIENFGHQSFVVATFAVNLLGSMIIGLLAGWLVHQPDGQLSQNAKLFIAAGVCGGFTTFSGFSFEMLTLLKNGNLAGAFGYAACSVLLCLGATALGYYLTSGSR